MAENISFILETASVAEELACLDAGDLGTNYSSTLSGIDPGYNQSVGSVTWNDSITEGNVYCEPVWDKVLCWPRSSAGVHVSLPCPSELDGIKLNINGRASKYCGETGAWTSKADYTGCYPYMDSHSDQPETGYLIADNLTATLIYCLGFSISEIALLIALIIFYCFRRLRCLRIVIHCNLMVTFLIRNALWLLLRVTIAQLYTENNFMKRMINPFSPALAGYSKNIQGMVSLFNYFQLASFAWMLTEGIVLQNGISSAFTSGSTSHKQYLWFGWGSPAVVIALWGSFRAALDNKECWLPSRESYWDYIYIVPAFSILIVNVALLFSIVWALYKKLSTEDQAVSQRSRYLKTIRATLMLMPLLGITYLIFAVEPNATDRGRILFVCFNALLQSSQGLFVPILYCFMNGQVRDTVKQFLIQATSRTNSRREGLM